MTIFTTICSIIVSLSSLFMALALYSALLAVLKQKKSTLIAQEMYFDRLRIDSELSTHK